MTERNEPWIIEFSRRLLEAGPARSAGVLRAAEEALGKLHTAQAHAELEIAARADVDPRLVQWLHFRLETPEERRERERLAYFQHLRGTALAVEGGHGVEIGLEMIEGALAQMIRAHDVGSWSQVQHNLAEALMQRAVGVRAENVERAVAAYRAALPGRQGAARIDTLLGLAQALRKRETGDESENGRDTERALVEAEGLLPKHGDRRRVVRVMLERAVLEEERPNLEAALQIVRRAADMPVDAELSWSVRDREASVLTTWAQIDPARRDEALAANRALMQDDRTQTTRRLAMVRARLRVLGEPVPITPDVLGQAALHWWVAELGDAPLAVELVRALELRIRREEREAFRLASGRALVRQEADLAPLVLRLATELRRAGEEVRAIGYLAHLGAWPLRRALRWTDFATSPAVGKIRQSRILEDRLAEVLRWAPVFDRYPGGPRPVAPGSVERLARYLSGRSNHAYLTPDDLAVLWTMPPEERSPAAVELQRGIESGVHATLAQIAEEQPPLFNAVAVPPFVQAGHFARRLSVREAVVLVQDVGMALVLGAAWRTSDGGLHTTLSQAEISSSGSSGDLPLTAELAVLATALREAGVARVGIVCRGDLARLIVAELAPLTAVGARVVHLVGVDDVSLPPLDRRRSRRYLVMLDRDPEQALPLILTVATTLREAGYVVLRPGATLDESTAAALADAQCVVFAGHGTGTLGPFGPEIGGQPVSHLDQLALGGTAWGMGLACSVGNSGRLEHLRWDHDDPAGAAEHLLLAGCRAAADCTAPVPEVLAALVLEELATRTAGGTEPEAAFAVAIEDWRRFWATLEEPLAEALAGGLSLEPSALSGWLTERLDGERRRRLGRDVQPLPRDGIFQALGVRASRPDVTAGRDAGAARELAAQVLAAFVLPEIWAAFRWVTRR